jgi:hypothetical protein
MRGEHFKRGFPSGTSQEAMHEIELLLTTDLALNEEMQIDEVRPVKFGRLVIYTVWTKNDVRNNPYCVQRVAFIRGGYKKWDMDAS